MSKHRTPLRYPGGKQKLAPFILEILKANSLIGGHYVEPYAGGSGVGLELLLSGHVSDIYLNDASICIYSFWNSVINETEKLCNLISVASLSIDEWKIRREIVNNPTKYSLLEVGFSTFYLNRCNRSGVLSGGVIGGLKQEGVWKMDARFSRNELIRRIEAIATKKNSIHIYNMDAEGFIKETVNHLPPNTLVYCDPPYFEKSSTLYLNKYDKKDHERIAKIIQNNLYKKWVLSYDSAPEILDYYEDRRSFIYDLQYNAAKIYKGKEIFVFADELIIPQASSLDYVNNSIYKAIQENSMDWLIFNTKKYTTNHSLIAKNFSQ